MVPLPPNTSRPLQRRPVPQANMLPSLQEFEPEAAMVPSRPESAAPVHRRPVPEMYKSKMLDFSEVDIPWSVQIAEPVSARKHPDSEVSPIILQNLSKSTLAAVLTDRNALASTCVSRDIDTNDSDLVNKVYSAMLSERRQRLSLLQRRFLMYLFSNNDRLLLERAFVAFFSVVQEKEEIVQGDLDAPGAPERLEADGRFKRVVTIQQKAQRLLKGLSALAATDFEERECPMMGVCIQILDPKDNRFRSKGLRIVGTSSTGKSWELTDGSYIGKDKEGEAWRALEPGTGSTTGLRGTSPQPARPATTSPQPACPAISDVKLPAISKKQRPSPIVRRRYGKNSFSRIQTIE
eukprot:gnl/MRDRNA2_/MRDRNA2_107460_c0_seq1.p1 gnl/MRDRNA2_/MRDRNA2_107460_c0~~gnl/MRDRNA2_/MRDRNA2_107460_c0_seq1.p1  ORF type:complete len:403 (-),score=66.53 gnl/MRDRNA2_/MRDRNA2_107460_c0_seq1:16-1065(-)